MARDETIKLSLIDGVTRTLGQIREGVSGVGASLTKLNQGAELAAKGFAALGSVASGIGDSVSAVADLELALARVSDITQATTAEQAALQQAVSDAATQVGVTADQAANALLLMAEDGFSASEAVGSLNAVLSFAKANAQDAATATQALGGVLDTFGEKPQIIAQLADQLTAASRAAGVGTTTLQQGLAAIGVQAEQAGLGVSDAIAALAALASRGIEGTQAAKQLGTVLTQLNDPASKAGKALDDAGLAGKSFGEVIEALSKDSTKAAAVLESLGDRPRAALKVLLDEGGGALRDFGLIVDEAAGASERAAAAIDETFKGAVSRLQAAIGNLRNELLLPILQPLAEEAAALAEKINALGDSPQFARIRDQFQELATNAIRSVGDLIEKADLEEWAGDVAEFGTKSKLVFDDVAYVAGKTADAIRRVSFAIKFLRGDKDLFSDSVDSLADGTERLGRAGADAGDTIADLGGNLASGERQTRSLVSEVLAAVGRLKEFASSMIEAGRASARASDDIATIFSPSEQAREQLLRLSGGAEQAAIGLERLRLATLTSAIAALARENLQGTDTFRALVAEVAKTEASIAKMQESIDKAKGAQKDLSDKTDSAANSLRNFASTAGDAGDAADDLKSSNSQVSDSFGNIGQAAAAAQADLGNMSKKLIDLAIQMQSQARSGRDVIDVWESINRQYQESEKRVQDRIALLERQNAAMDEEAQIRRRLVAMYGDDTTSIERLVQLELQRTQAVRERADLAEREAAVIERQQAAIAGGFGAQQTQQEQAPAATGGRGSAAGGGRSAPQIVINVQGMTTDQARAFVEQSVVPELERINRLSR